MKRLFTMLLLLVACSAVYAKQQHAHVTKHTHGKVVKHTAAHKGHHYAHHTVRRKPAPKIDAALLAQIDQDTAAAHYSGIQSLLYTMVKELGKPYKMGSCGPTGYDCSGLMNYAFSIIGMQLPRTSKEIGQLGEKIAFDELKPGDLVFFTGRNNHSKSRRIGHVGCVYKVDPQTGKVLMIHSSEEGVNITEITDSKYYMERFITARRILGLDTCALPQSKM